MISRETFVQKYCTEKLPPNKMLKEVCSTFLKAFAYFGIVRLFYRPHRLAYEHRSLRLLNKV